MPELEVVNLDNSLARQRILAGDTQKYHLRFFGVFDQGVILMDATATVTSPASTVSIPTLSEDKKSVFWLVTAALLTETFTLALVITTNDGQILNFTCVYDVEGPVVETTSPNPLPLIIGPTGPTGPFNGVKQNIQNTAYTTVLSDANEVIYHPAADTTARIWTIDSNANVPYPVGTYLYFVNEHGAGVITLAITADTLRLAGTGSTGNRTLAADGFATAYKMTSTSWLIYGTGLT